MDRHGRQGKFGKTGKGRTTLPDQTMDDPGGNSCAENCYDFYVPKMNACQEASYGGELCPGYCESERICDTTYDFAEEEHCLNYVWICRWNNLHDQYWDCMYNCAGQGAFTSPADAPQKGWRHGGRVKRRRR